MTVATRPVWLRLALRRLAILAGIIVALAVVAAGVYLAAPQWLLRGHTWYAAHEAGLKAESLQVGDTRWAYYTGGNGPTIMLLHGFGLDKTEWLQVAPLLTAHFRVIIPDLPGWGASTHVAGADPGLNAEADQLAGFVAALELQPFVLVGHSMGGAIAGLYAAAHPNALAGLVLVDSYGLSFKPNDYARRYLDTGVNPFVYDDRAGFRRLLQLAFLTPPKVPGRIIDVMVARNQANRAFLQRAWQQQRQPDQAHVLDAHLSELTMPVLAVWCRDDKLMDLSALDTLRRGLDHAPSIDATVLSGCNHMPTLEQPAAAARVIADFTLKH